MKDLGEQVIAWQREFEGSNDLQHQFQFSVAYVNRRLRDTWSKSPELRQAFHDDYRAFSTAAKKAGCKLAAAKEEEVRKDLEDTRKAASFNNSVSRFLVHLLAKQ